MSAPDRIYVVQVWREVFVRASDEMTGWDGPEKHMATRPGSLPEMRNCQYPCGDIDLQEVMDIHPLRVDGSVDPKTIRELLADGEVTTQPLPDGDEPFQV